MTDKEHFIDIMNRIRVGSFIGYYGSNIYDNNRDNFIYTAKVEKIIKCDQNSHEGCKYCIGNIYLEHYGNEPFATSSTCFKMDKSWRTKIVFVNNFDFITEEEFSV